jgi:hypothetical protein
MVLSACCPLDCRQQPWDRCPAKRLHVAKYVNRSIAQILRCGYDHVGIEGPVHEMKPESKLRGSVALCEVESF